MTSKANQLIVISSLLVLGTYFLFFGLTKAHTFLAPITIAVLLSLLMIPFSNKLESWGLTRGWAAFISDLVLMGFFIGLFVVLSAQVQSIAKDWPQMKRDLEPKIEKVQEFIAKHTPYTVEEQNRKIEEKIPGGDDSTQGEDSQQESSSSQSSGVGSVVGTAIMSFFGFLGSTLLTFVYIFFFLLYRTKFKKSILEFVPEENREKGKTIIQDSSKVSQNYLVGKLLLILFLGLLYAIGLSISGVQHAILISVLAAIFSLIPYLGNMIGFALAISMALFSGGDVSALIGVTVTFSIAQFVESYILEPYIVGDKVDLHPIFTIIAVVLGEAVFGIIGMIIAIPVFGIIKVICDQVEVLRPVGYLLGDQKEKNDNSEEGFMKKIYEKFRRE